MLLIYYNILDTIEESNYFTDIIISSVRACVCECK